MKKNEKVKNGEEPVSGKKRGKESKVSLAFLICEVRDCPDLGLFGSLVVF